jgi:hypothetical protein
MTSHVRVVEVYPSDRLPNGDRAVVWMYLVGDDPKPQTNSAHESELRSVMEKLNPMSLPDLEEARRALSLPAPKRESGVLAAVATLRGLAEHRERMPDCLCRQDDQAGKTPRTASDHAAPCHERNVIERLRAVAAAAEAEYRGFFADIS